MWTTCLQLQKRTETSRIQWEQKHPSPSLLLARRTFFHRSKLDYSEPLRETWWARPGTHGTWKALSQLKSPAWPIAYMSSGEATTNSVWMADSSVDWDGHQERKPCHSVWFYSCWDAISLCHCHFCSLESPRYLLWCQCTCSWSRYSFMCWLWRKIEPLIFSTDPGIIPRRQFLQLERLRLEHRVVDKRLLVSDDKKAYCYTCKIHRPLKSTHCKICGNCVEEFDHHCGFLDACIGKYNYVYFVGFLFSFMLMSAFETIGFLVYIFVQVSERIDIGGTYCRSTVNH